MEYKWDYFPVMAKHVSGALIKGGEYKPSSDGTIIYLNGGDDLQVVLDKIEVNSGKVL